MFAYNRIKTGGVLVSILKPEDIWPQIVCFYPFYNSDGGNNTRVLLQDGRECLDRRKTKTFLQAVAKVFAADLTALRKKYRDYLGHKGLVPLPLHTSFILVPVKVRRVQYKDHGATGYAVLDKVVDIYLPETQLPDAAFCRLTLKGGGSFECMEKPVTIKRRLAEASQVQKEYSRFCRGKESPLPDLDRFGLKHAGEGTVVYHIHYHRGDIPDSAGC
jgi:hypothetical protein